MFPILEYQLAYCGANDEVHLPFNFGLILHPFLPSILREFIRSYDQAMSTTGWPNYTLGNHDVARVATRIGQCRATMAALLLLTLRGTPFIYNGEELGLENVAIPIERILDPWGKSCPEAARDAARTPMPWGPAPNGGFSTVEPWLPIGEENARRDVRTQMQDPGSALHFYRRLLHFRRESPAMQFGSLCMLDNGQDEYLLFERQAEQECLLIALNFGSKTHHVSLPAGSELLLTSEQSEGEILGPFAGKIFRVPNES